MTTSTMTTDDFTNNDLSNIYSDNLLDGSFAQIDWQAPWLSHLEQLNYLRTTTKQLSASGECQRQVASSNIDSEFAEAARQIDIIAAVLNQALKQQSEANNSSLPTTKPTTDNKAQALKFVSQDALPEGMGYEQFIGTTGQIPTRDNLHDLFNGSIWLSFPKTKALLNYYHMLEMADDNNKKSQRGRVRDTITVFDENGAVLVTSKPSVGEALMDFDWQNSLVKPRESWDNPKLSNENAKAAVYIFGHALLEQLIEPRKPLCAHSVVITVNQDYFALSTAERINYLDDKLAQYMDKLLSEQNVTPRKLAPLPILGVPHFWPDNSETSFYEDQFVFRSGRHRQK